MVSHNRGARGAHYRDIHSTKLLKGQERKQRKLAEHYQGLDEKKEKVYVCYTPAIPHHLALDSLFLIEAFDKQCVVADVGCLDIRKSKYV